MIKETDFKSMKKRLLEDASAHFYIIQNNPPKYLNFSHIHPCISLAPSVPLAREYRLGNITEEEYKEKYTKELERPLVQELKTWIQNEAQHSDVYIVSESADRFILMDVLKN